MKKDSSSLVFNIFGWLFWVAIILIIALNMNCATDKAPVTPIPENQIIILQLNETWSEFQRIDYFIYYSNELGLDGYRLIDVVHIDDLTYELHYRLGAK